MPLPRHAGMQRFEAGFPGGRGGEGQGSEALTRRSALRVFALPIAVTVPAALFGCSKAPKCDDTSGLSPEAKKARVETAAYVEMSMDATKRCERCTHFNPGGENQCGTCKVVQGPINPKGTCTLFVAKT